MVAKVLGKRIKELFIIKNVEIRQMQNNILKNEFHNLIEKRRIYVFHDFYIDASHKKIKNNLKTTLFGWTGQIIYLLNAFIAIYIFKPINLNFHAIKICSQIACIFVI